MEQQKNHEPNIQANFSTMEEIFNAIKRIDNIDTSKVRPREVIDQVMCAIKDLDCNNIFNSSFSCSFQKLIRSELVKIYTKISKKLDEDINISTFSYRKESAPMCDDQKRMEIRDDSK